jgi:hypothetical protein
VETLDADGFGPGAATYSYNVYQGNDFDRSDDTAPVIDGKGDKR